MIPFNSMPQPEQIPALVLGEPAMSSELCSVPAKLVMSPALCALVQRKRPGPSQDLATVLQSCFINKHPPKSLKVIRVQAQPKVH